jgi:Ser/Thr protein kinase RdoA (MazF antagonist)
MYEQRDAEVSDALAAFGLSGLAIREVAHGGLINRTWVAGDPPMYVLQCVNALFSPETHERFAAVTAHLHAAGLLTPLLVPLPDGRKVLPGTEGTCWRLQSYVPGRSLDRLPSPEHAAQAGSLVARFHAALQDFPGDLTPLRPEAHDTVRHMTRLDEAMRLASSHRLCDGIRSTGAAIREGWVRWCAAVQPDGRLPGVDRPAHGDLKVSNIRFDAMGKEALCLVDLDTLGSLQVGLEMGDALRSWCNLAGEDGSARFDEAIFEAAVKAYGARATFLPRAELLTLVPGLWRIALELAARFCADAYFENRFAWNPEVAPGRGEHNLVRAQGQLELAGQVESARHRLLALVATAV